jgi:hypothetical protein
MLVGGGGARGARSDSRALGGSTFCGYMAGEKGSGAAVQNGMWGYGTCGGALFAGGVVAAQIGGSSE